MCHSSPLPLPPPLPPPPRPPPFPTAQAGLERDPLPDLVCFVSLVKWVQKYVRTLPGAEGQAWNIWEDVCYAVLMSQGWEVAALTTFLRHHCKMLEAHLAARLSMIEEHRQDLPQQPQVALPEHTPKS